MAEHTGLTSRTSSNIILMADQSHCCLIISSTAPNDIQNCPSFRSVTLWSCLILNWTVIRTSDVVMAVVKWKQGFLSDFLPVVYWQWLSRTRVVDAALNQKWLGTFTSEYCIFCLTAAVVVAGEKCVLVAKNRTASEHTDLLFTGSWLTWTHRLMATPDLVGLKSQSTS